MLTDDLIDELSREMVKGHKSVNWLARKIAAEVRKEDAALIQGLADALASCSAVPHWPAHQPILAAARARLGDKEPT